MLDSDSVKEKPVENELLETLAPDDTVADTGNSAPIDGSPGGIGRCLGVFDCTMLIVGSIIGTGIFSTPSSILVSVGSVGASLMLWVLGFLLSFCGLFVWLEYGTMFPRSGGEKVYLEVVYKKPKYLVTVIFAMKAILLGFTASGCIVFANNILVAAGQPATRWVVRGIALGVIFFVTFLHGFAPRVGVHLMNVSPRVHDTVESPTTDLDQCLSLFKIAILIFIVISGWAVLSGKTDIADPHANFQHAFAGSSTRSNNYAAATFKVLNAYTGWSTVNYVLNDVKNPVRTLKIAGPLGLAICAVLYILANISYFAAATKEEIATAGVTVASLFFRKVFGRVAQRALSVFVALRCDDMCIFYVATTHSVLSHLQKRVGSESTVTALNNVITVTFAASRVNQELAKEGIPLPFGNRFWASNWPTGRSPLPGLIIHLIPSVIVIMAPPPQIVYPFILDVEGYPQQIINFFIVIGLFWLRYHKPSVIRPFKVWWPLAVFFLAAAVFLMIAPFLPPADGIGDTPPLPYYLYCLVGIGILLLGIVYWGIWRIVLPKAFGYYLTPRKETLADGTVVTVFSHAATD
ncbi:amino acid transporter [Macrolepiota fuliginosa MF-IS2]|uniref:Amino acid transporter n=1 Tax=Macrolepiota fuliginosa MF-IS2 TaxID=1400762 RepID=A0A9P6C2C1_9AGAR|nr:amino acid transporter [Macrolepiota fuliginosa MF-IS2]